MKQRNYYFNHILIIISLICLEASAQKSQQALIKSEIKPMQLEFTPATDMQPLQTGAKQTEDTKITAPTATPPERILTSKDKRKHKTKKGTTRRITMREMNLEQLKERKNQMIAQGDKETAIRYLEKMIPLSKDMHESKDLSLELAGLLFENADYEKAAKLYTDFAKLYPGNEKVEDAIHYEILCSQKGILAATQDQTKTRETLELTIKFLERGDVFTKHKNHVIEIQNKCYARLRESEESIIAFYINRGSYKAAKNRIESLKKDYLPKFPEWQEITLSLETDLAKHQNNLELATQLEQEMITKFPKQSLELAQGKKVNLMDKF